nr:calcium/calmodulin-regulated receptor-like kinase 1 [Ipomoea batatas]
MTTDGKGGWEEIVDSRLNWKYDVQELNDVASLAYKCVNRVPKKRSSMRDAVQVLARILESRRSKEHHKQLAATPEEPQLHSVAAGDEQASKVLANWLSFHVQASIATYVPFAEWKIFTFSKARMKEYQEDYGLLGLGSEGEETQSQRHEI